MATIETQSPAIELDSIRSSHSTSSNHEDASSLSQHEPRGQSLPPTDHGRGAYTALACCTLAQAPIWGYAVSFSIFQEYYSHDPSLSASTGSIASIGTTQMGAMYLIMPLIFIILNLYPYLRPFCGPMGLLITVTSLCASAFVTSIAGLIATQGALYAIGCGLLFSPVSSYMDEWWVERKGLAHGVMWAGKSIVGVVMPFAFSGLLDKFGLKATLLAWAIASALLTLPTLLFLKPRVPLQRNPSSRARPLSFAFLRSSSFWVMQTGIIVQALGYMMPNTYLASYASAIGLPSITGPILVALFSLASVPGSFIHGFLGDKMTATKVILISSLGSALPVFLLWGLSRRLAAMVVFVLLYGFFAGGFSASWSSMLHMMKREDAETDTSIVFGMLLGGRGLGFVLGGPVSGALLDIKAHMGPASSGYATGYGSVMLFTGVTALLGALASFWTIARRAKWGKMARRVGCVTG